LLSIWLSLVVVVVVMLVEAVLVVSAQEPVYQSRLELLTQLLLAVAAMLARMTEQEHLEATLYLAQLHLLVAVMVEIMQLTMQVPEVLVVAAVELKTHRLLLFPVVLAIPHL
jgi:hypothetical protein